MHTVRLPVSQHGPFSNTQDVREGVSTTGLDVLAGLALPDANGSPLDGELKRRGVLAGLRTRSGRYPCALPCKEGHRSLQANLPTRPPARGLRSPRTAPLSLRRANLLTLPQKEQKYLECWDTSIFLICFLSEAP